MAFWTDKYKVIKLDRKKLDDWEKLTNAVLKSSRDFMRSCNEKFGRGFIGELLTFSQLISRYKSEFSIANNELIYYGSSKKGVDIRMVLNGNNIEINSKGTTVHDKMGPKWVRQHARSFCIIQDIGDISKIIPRTDYLPNFFYIYVDIKKWIDGGSPDFFILSDEDAKKTFGEVYKSNYDGKPKRKTDSDDMWVLYSDIKGFKDNDLSLFKKFI